MSFVSIVAPDLKSPFGIDTSRCKDALVDYGRKIASAKTFEIYQDDEVFVEENIHNGIMRKLNESKREANNSHKDEAFGMYEQKDEFVEENMHASTMSKVNESRKEANANMSNSAYGMYEQKDEFVEENMHASTMSKTEDKGTFNEEGFEMYWKNGSFVEVSIEDRSISKLT